MISLSRSAAHGQMATNGKHGKTWTRIESSDSTADESFLAAYPEEKNPFSYLFNMLRQGSLVQITAPDHVVEAKNNTTTWQERVSLFCMQALSSLRSPLASFGLVLELTANTLIANGGLIRTLYRLIYNALFLFKKGPLVVPTQDSADYLSIIGMLDPRRTLLPLVDGSTSSDHKQNGDCGSIDHARKDIFPGLVTGDRRIVDLMLMAAKFAYENEALVKEVVANTWEMNFVGFYNCWNEYQQRWNKQVFVFTDKLDDAQAIIVVWKGTAPFDADDWSTDIDFSWYDLQDDAGKVHIGFLEALGLGDRHDMDTFAHCRRNASRKKAKTRDFSQQTESAPSPPASGLPQDIIDAPDKILAYDYITELVKELLEKNPKAKLFITGHSLGGALAVLYSGMLYYFGEQCVTDRIAAVYTFGQPRVGDEQFCTFMLNNLSVERYFRVVYCNDLIPRVPFDDALFQFKHWGFCFYFSTIYEDQRLKEEPNRNYFSIWEFFSVHANAVWELVNSLFMGYKHGPDYKESTASLLFRIVALFVPGFGDHSPVNYNNALRLGRPMPLITKLD